MTLNYVQISPQLHIQGDKYMNDSCTYTYTYICVSVFFQRNIMTIKCLRKCCEFPNSCIYIHRYVASTHTHAWTYCINTSIHANMYSCIYIHCVRVCECVCAVERQLTLLGVSKQYRCGVSVIVKQVKSATYILPLYVCMYYIYRHIVLLA